MVRVACLQLDIVVRPGIHIVPNALAGMNSRDSDGVDCLDKYKERIRRRIPIEVRSITWGDSRGLFYYPTQRQACNTARVLKNALISGKFQSNKDHISISNDWNVEVDG